jgi:hypothetical protein
LGAHRTFEIASSNSFVVFPVYRSLQAQSAKMSVQSYQFTIFRKEDEINVANVDDSYKASCELFNHEITWYKNECTTYKEYIEKLLPSFENFINCYLNTKFLNFSHILKELETLQIEKLNKTTYDILFEILKKNVNDFYRSEAENRKLNTREKKQNLIIKDMTVIGALLRDYYPLKNDYFYSISEIFKSGLIDCYHYYTLQTNQNVRVLDSEVEQMILSIKKEFETPQKDRIHKIYETDQQRKEDNNKKIVLQDIPWEKGIISAGELLHRELIKRNSMFYTTLKHRYENATPPRSPLPTVFLTCDVL